MTNTNRLIAEAIVQAQIASDAGKGIYAIRLRNGADRPGIHSGYNEKEGYILKALNLISSAPRSKYTFWVVEEADQNGHPSILVYFVWKGNQVSFHTPRSKASSALLRCVNKGVPTEWNGVIGGSREACLHLVEKYNL